MTFIFIIYVIAGVVLFNTRSKIKSLSFIEWLFVPALIVGNVTLFLFFLFVGLIARLFGRRQVYMANFLFIVIVWVVSIVHYLLADASDFANGFYIGSAFMFTVFVFVDFMEGKK